MVGPKPWVVAAVCGLSACGGARDSTERLDPARLGYTVDAARAFQVEADRQLAAAVSPLSAVDATYLTPGESMVVPDDPLGPESTAPRPTGPAPGALTIRVAEGGPISVRRATARGEVAVDPAAGPIPLGRRRVVVSAQAGGARVVIHDPQAPARLAFRARPWFPIDAGAIVAVRTRPADGTTTVALRTSRGLDKALRVVGTLEGRLAGVAFTLTAYGAPEGDWLVPFTDPTNGEATYVVGRYLTVPPEARRPGHAVLDFNRATNPWCAYSELYNCPIPPSANAVPVVVQAGERAAPDH